MPQKDGIQTKLDNIERKIDKIDLALRRRWGLSVQFFGVTVMIAALALTSQDTRLRFIFFFVGVAIVLVGILAPLNWPKRKS